MKYIGIDDLQAYCDNQKDHSITPNEFQRMNHIEIVRCKDCRKRREWFCELDGKYHSPNFFCGFGKPKDGEEDG